MPTSQDWNSPADEAADQYFDGGAAGGNGGNGGNGADWSWIGDLVGGVLAGVGSIVGANTSDGTITAADGRSFYQGADGNWYQVGGPPASQAPPPTPQPGALAGVTQLLNNPLVLVALVAWLLR